jgi:PAS domain S-box-containing protein
LKKPIDDASRLAELRRRAEQQLRERQKSDRAAETDVRKLQHELLVNQIELEMVNKELAISEERARQAIEASNAAMWDYDLTTGEVYLSEAWSSFLGGGKKPTHTTIQALTELVPEEERLMVREAIIQAIRVGGSSEYQMNHQVKKPDGDFIWLHSRGRVVERGPDGRTRRMIGMGFDITKRFQAEARLIENEQKFRALFESAGDYALVLQLHESGPPIIVDGNAAFFEKHGYTRKELIGQPVTLIETASSAGHIEQRKELVKSGDIVHFEVEHVCKNGSTFIADAVVRMVQSGDGNIVYSVERDTTERRRAEQEQQRLLRENRRLLQRLIRVQEEERRSLARDLHDDLGQLLTSIDARAEYIAKHALHADVRDMGVEIIRDTRASFAASRATLSKLRPAVLDALGLTAALTELTDKAKGKMGMDCALHIEGDIDQTDDIRAITIYRLVQEALTNAHRHGKADQAEVGVKYVPPHEGKGGLIKVEVDDNGRGFDEKKVSEGMGVIGMRERVAALGGAFLFSHSPHGGVRIEAILSLNDEKEL